MSRYYNDELYHFGIKHRSGRYKWGSGERPYQGEGGVKGGSSSKAKSIGKGAAIGAAAAATGYAAYKTANPSLSNTRAQQNRIDKVDAAKAKVKRGAEITFEPNLKGGKNNPNVSAFENSAKQSQKAIESLQKTHQQLNNSKALKATPEQQRQMDKMSNKELQEVITRKNLERNYLLATQDPAVEDGYNRVQNILAVAGTGATILAAGATIYSSFKNSKNA